MTIAAGEWDAVVEYCAREGVSTASFYNWRRRLAGEDRSRDSVPERPAFLPVTFATGPSPWHRDSAPGRGDDPRVSDGPLRWLDGFAGYLQVDGYGGYDGLYRDPNRNIIEIACWATRWYWWEWKRSDARLYQVEPDLKASK